MLKFSEYNDINEGFFDNLKDKLSNDQIGAKRYVLDLLDKTVDSSELLDLQNFIKSYLEANKSSYIIGLNDDSELFEFYVKYQAELDELLSNDNFFTESPKKIGVMSVYDYVVKASKKALHILLTNISEESFS